MASSSHMMLLLLLTICKLISILNGQQQLTTCNVRQNPFSYSTPTTGQALGITFYIDLNNPFTCYGVITKWRLCYRRSSGALSDTIKIGIYQPDDNGERFIRKGSNSIYLQLQHSDCLNITADPQIVVQEGDLIAFYATLIYVKFYDDPTNGYLYKSVAFPTSISRGTLIKTSNPYAPKIGAYIDPINPSTPTSTTISSSTDASLTTSTTTTPSPTSESGIPPPDLLSDQCLVGVNEAFVQTFQETFTTVLSLQFPSLCSGVVERWEFCYQYINETANIQIGVWRPDDNNTQFTFVGSDEITVLPKSIHFIDTLVCSVVSSSNTILLEEGDVVGFNSSDIAMAFTDRQIMKRSATNDTLMPLLRAIVRIQTSTNLSSSSLIPTSSPSLSPSPASTKSRSYLGITLGIIISIIMTVTVFVIVVIVMYYVIKKRSDGTRSNLIDRSRDDMIYNVQYVPNDPTAIIISNRKHSLGFKPNPSYASSSIVTDLGELPMPPTSSSNEHVYESI